jgi:penicillin-binding protein 1A
MSRNAKKITKSLWNFLKKVWHGTVNFCKWYIAYYKSHNRYVKGIMLFCTLIVAFFLYLGAVDMNLFWLFGKSPGWIEISQHKTSEASEIYSADSVLIGKFYNENRTPVEYDDVNPAFWEALIDTEDERYYKHWGIDPLGLVGAVKDAITGRGGRGASTITQQLAKNMFRVRTQYSTGIMGKIPGLAILIMKTKEWITATKLEIYFSVTMGREAGKKEILRQYANTVDFGHNAYGIKTAAKTYFDCTPKELSVEKAAVLVGTLKGTTIFNPISHPDNSLLRRNVVMNNMVEHGHLTQAEFDQLKKLPLGLNFVQLESEKSGIAPYFRDAIAKYIKSLSEEIDDLSDLDLYNDGLKIYTTLDTRMQKYAEEAAAKQMEVVQKNFDSHWKNMEPWRDEHGQVIPNFIEDIAKRLYEKNPKVLEDSAFYAHTLDSIRHMVSYMHCAFVAMEPQTGYVKAWVGDIDYDRWKYDKVTAMRQPGSTFKLFVYTEAMEQGLTPCDKRRDEFFSMEVWDKDQKKNVIWSPTNANGTFSNDSLPLKTAFAQSINSVAVRLGQEIGINHIAETAHNMGIISPLNETPSLALGSSDVNLLELTNAYCTIADNGKTHPDAILITRIEDRKGNVIYTAPTEKSQSISERAAMLMQTMLMAGLTERNGTSAALNRYVGGFQDTDFGGKTGTSNNHSDAWFMGVTPNLVVGAWVGGEYRCIHFRTGALGQGSRTALPICGLFLQNVMSDPKFKKYRGHFMRDPMVIEQYMYDCTYKSSAYTDTLEVDTIENEIMLNEEEVTFENI